MYQPREIKKLSILPHNDINWKQYLIRYNHHEPADALIEAAGRLLTDGDTPVDPSHKAGFLVIHAGMDMDFILIGYWVNGNELMLKVWKCAPGQTDQLMAADLNTSSMACTWDIVVINHERDAWVKHILTPAEPDVDAYVHDQLAGFR